MSCIRRFVWLSLFDDSGRSVGVRVPGGDTGDPSRPRARPRGGGALKVRPIKEHIIVDTLVNDV